MSILDAVGCDMPSLFQYLSDKKLINSDHVLFTKDGFYMIGKFISSILISNRTDTIPDREDKILKCRYLFDDWFLFAVPGKNGYEYEKLTILATHTGNVSLYSFTAEIRYHAMFLKKLMKIRFPFGGSPYSSAVRADMSIGDKEFQEPVPHYDLSGKLVCEQMKYCSEL